MGKEIVNALTPDPLLQQNWYPDYLHLLSQLLTWCFLSERRELSEAIRFNDHVMDELNGQPVTDVLSSQLKRVLEFRTDSVWLSAWSDHDVYLRSIPPAEVERLLTSVITAKRHNLIKFDELPYILYEKYSETSPVIPIELRELIAQIIAHVPQDTLYLTGDEGFGLAPLFLGKQFQIFSEQHCAESMHSLITLLSYQITLRVGDPVLSPGFFEQNRLRTFACGVGVLLQDHRYKQHEVRDLFGRFEPNTRLREMLFITHLLKQCAGESVVLVPGRFLIKNTTEHKRFRQYLVSNGRIDTIVRLPAGLLPGRAQPLFLLRFSEQATDNIRLINCDHDYFKAVAIKKRGEAKFQLIHSDVLMEELSSTESSQFCTQVSLSELRAEYFADMPLDPAYYLGKNRTVVIRPGSSAVRGLSSTFDVIRAQAVKGADRSHETDTRVYLEVTVQDINDAGIIDQPAREVHVIPDRLKRAEGQTLRAGDILLAIKGQAGRLAMVPDVCGNNWMAGQSFVILRQKSGNVLKSPVVLFRFLKSETGQKLIRSICTDDVVPFIHSQDLKQLPIPQWSELEQEQACMAHEEILKLYARMKFFREKAEFVEREILREA
ncbi:N-6 DNA methylase [Endozoicomonas ascidiicola]|uniref:N-6 DNA methylase n=1 Tax=Endozoicomonas ascidiicola TaxID=1698521 RepID=UPI0008346C5C|nr:N-6 DNA methylase [Endozoicomonas ascidiicola]